MINLSKLRKSIKNKLEHRRNLARHASALENQNAMLKDMLNEPMIEVASRECADSIINAVMSHAVKTSAFVADETVDGDAFVVGINIPALYVRQIVYKPSPSDRWLYQPTNNIKHIEYKGDTNE